MKLLNNGTYGSIEELATAVKLSPNIERQCIAAAFLDLAITEAILQGSDHPIGLPSHRPRVPLN